MKLIKYTPLVLFIIMAIFFYSKIKNQNKLEPLSSALINKEFPKLDIYNSSKNQSINNYIKDKPVIINIFASWCAPCRIEHKVLKNYSEKYDIIGIAYKDSEENIEKFLVELGDPFDNIFFDFLGKESINLGLYGVPETFFLNKDGKILYKHIGPINKEDFEKLAPMILKQ